MPSIQGSEVTFDNIESMLSRCASNQGGEFRPASESWGLAAAGLFLNEIKESALYVAAQDALAGFLLSGNEDQTRFAASVANPTFVSVETWTAALAREDLDDATREEMRFSLSMAARRSRGAYGSWMRQFVGQSSWDWFMAAYNFWDHDWFMANLPILLAAADMRPLATFSFSHQHMNRAEALRYRGELAGRREQLGNEFLDPLLAQIDTMLAEDRYLPGDGAIRWLDA